MSDHESSDITEPVDRTALGGSPRSSREQRQRDNRPPASPEELSRGADELADERDRLLAYRTRYGSAAD